MAAQKILVVDDEKDLCEILQFNLESEGFEVEVYIFLSTMSALFFSITLAHSSCSCLYCSERNM